MPVVETINNMIATTTNRPMTPQSAAVPALNVVVATPKKVTNAGAITYETKMTMRNSPIIPATAPECPLPAFQRLPSTEPKIPAPANTTFTFSENHLPILDNPEYRTSLPMLDSGS